MLRNVRSAGITGLGKYVPDRVLTNFDLEKMVDTSDEWIRTRTGISERRLADDNEATADLAVKAGEAALQDAGISAEDVDIVVVATLSPDCVIPATGCLVQDRLGATRAGAFDMEAGCTGFVYGLSMAGGYVSSGIADTVLLIGAECLSRVTNWQDRSTCVLFGDGAGAAVIQPVAEEEGFLAFDLGSDGSGGELLKIEAGGSRRPASRETVDNALHFINMNGNEVFRFAVKIMEQSVENALGKCGLTSDQVDCFVPHQASTRIIEAAAKRLNLPPEKVFINIDRYGNTSAASIPIALTECKVEGRIKKGDLVVCVGFGAGLTWGSCVLRWS